MYLFTKNFLGVRTIPRDGLPATQVRAAEIRAITRSCLHALFYFVFRPDSRIWIRHETDRHKCYGCKNTGNFGVSANRIQWPTSRTRIRPKSKKNKVKTLFGLPEQDRVQVRAARFGPLGLCQGEVLPVTCIGVLKQHL